MHVRALFADLTCLRCYYASGTRLNQICKKRYCIDLSELNLHTTWYIICNYSSRFILSGSTTRLHLIWFRFKACVPLNFFPFFFKYHKHVLFLYNNGSTVISVVIRFFFFFSFNWWWLPLQSCPPLISFQDLLFSRVKAI